MIPLPDSLVCPVLAVLVLSAVGAGAVALVGALADYLSRRAKRSAEERR